MQNDTQIQVRIDAKTKKAAKKLYDKIGLDLSTVLKLTLKQSLLVGGLPFEIRDENGYTKKFREELLESIKDAESSGKSFSSVKTLIKDLEK